MGEFEERVAQLSEKKRALLELARKRAARAPGDGNGEPRPQARATIAPRPPGLDRLPLSVNQEQLWFLDQLAPGQPTYNIIQGLRLRGPLDFDALRSSLDRLVARHEALRTTFGSEHGEPYQVIAPPEVGATVALTDLSDLDGQEAEEALRAVIEEHEVRAPFDLAAGPLFRARLITMGQDDHVITLGVHHSVADGWSVSVLNAELSELYAAAVSGRDPVLPELGVQYPDYALWQRQYLGSETYRRSVEFWKERCRDLPVLELPTDRPRPAVPTYRGDVISHRIGKELVDRLRDLSRRSGASLYMTLQAAYLALMVRYTGQEDVVTGTPVNGRTRPELERLVGFFVNMVVLRLDATGDPTFTELLARTREMLLNTWDHQEVPFEKVVDEVQPEREAGRNPLFQSGMQVLSATTSGGAPEFAGLGADQLGLKSTRSRFDLAVSATEFPDEVTFSAEYSTELFDQTRIERLLRHLSRILEAVVEDPSLRISELPVLSEEEERRILVDWQGPEVPYEPTTIHRMVRDQVARTPDAVAVRYEGQDMTYAELDRRSDAVAHHLRALGVRREELVAMALERDLHVLVALVGIMKAGAAFVPLDVGYPEARMRFILEDIEARFVLTREEFAGAIPEGPWRRVLIDRSWPEIEAGAPEGPPEDWATPDSLAYVIYTSGSTGQPKGVLIEHAHMVNHLVWWRDVPRIGLGDVLLQFSSIVFDLSEGEIFAALTQGATVLFTDKDTLVNPTAVADLMRRERVTYIGAPPAMLALLEAEPYPDLRAMVAGGEAFSGELVNRWNVDGRMFVNGYGPTETTVGCIVNVCRGREWLSSPPIGSPMANRRAYVVDRWGNLLPVGVPGELLIGGHGVGRGYLKRAELTAEKFVPDRFSPRPGARAYRSGDLVEWTEEGELQFLGRIDTQVKLRGYRIELEEIEAVLASHPAVAGATVILRDDPPGGKRLVGYVMPRDDDPPSVTDLRDHLGRYLPPYMIPSAFVTMSALPLTATGKVNRAALPAPEAAGTDQHRPHVAPRTEAEELVAGVFADILAVERVGAEDNFFELGGNSLQGARVVARLAEASGVTVSLREFYTSPTVASMAALLDPAGAGTAAADDGQGWTPLVGIKPSGSRTPFFAPHAVSGSPFSYMGLARLLDPDQPMYGFEAPGLEGNRPVAHSVDELATIYLEALRQAMPTGPYYLGGWSMGGFVAFEMARRLVEEGEEVGLVALIDSDAPGPNEPPDEVECMRLFIGDLSGIMGRPAPELDGSVEGLDTQERMAVLLQTLREADLMPPDIDERFLLNRFSVFQANARAMYLYQPRPYPGTVTTIRARESAAVRDAAAGWARWAGRIEDHLVPGNHYTIWADPNVRTLAETLQGCLDRVNAGAGKEPVPGA